MPHYGHTSKVKPRGLHIQQDPVDDIDLKRGGQMKGKHTFLESLLGASEENCYCGSDTLQLMVGENITAEDMEDPNDFTTVVDPLDDACWIITISEKEKQRLIKNTYH